MEKNTKNRPLMNERLPEYIIERVHLSIGEASMCWEKIKKAGIFESEMAKEIASNLCNFIANELESRKIFKFAIGAKVVDHITKFTGTIMARTQYLTGCNRYGILREKIEPTENIPDWEWLDETRLKLRNVVKIIVKTNEDNPGGSRQNAPK